MFMGDNGFAFGEHGLIDKRTAYEESMRVPLLMAGGGLAGGRDGRGGGREHRHRADGSRSRRAHAAGRWTAGASCRWRAASRCRGATRCSTSTTGSATSRRRRRCTPCAATRYKYIRYYGIWDTDELYDLQRRSAGDAQPDPRSRASATTVKRMNAQLFETLAPPMACSSRCPDRGAPQQPAAPGRRDVGGVSLLYLFPR